MNEQIFKQDAKTIVDILFDGKFFKEGITRDHMAAVEEIIYYQLESKFNGYVKSRLLLTKLEKSQIA